MAVKYDPILDALREADTSGSSDTASNLGTGVGVYSYKNSGVFYFNSLADSTTIGVSTASGGNITFNLLSIPSALIPDPLNINNLNVYSTASINRLDVQNTYFSLTGGITPLVEGQLSWDATNGHLHYGLPGGNVEIALGMENVLPKRCKNESGTTMTKGTVVYISSVSGNDPVISRALATSDATSAFTIGVCGEDILDGQKGWVTTYGLVSGLNLASYSAGDTVYLSGTTAGTFTKTKPYAPIHYVRVGIVTKATSSGDLYVQVINGFEMDELHNVSAQSAASGDILRYNTSTSLWEKTGLVTPQTKSLISGQFLDSYDATTGLFTSSVLNSSNITHNNLAGLQGGTAGEYNHLTNAQVTNLNNQSGTNTGDETKTSIETKLGAATSSNSGYLTSTDWSTFNGKLTPNSPITGATKTKITYDANGLVTAGADATTADIADSTNKRYVTDADLTKLSNTSGTNTGDVTVTDSSTIDFTLAGQALTGSVIENGITHNNLGSLQGGTAGQYNHLTNAELTAVQGLSTGYLKLDLSNTPLTGTTLNFDSTNNKSVNINRVTNALNEGRNLTITAGGAGTGASNKLGGNLILSSGIATGNQGSDITFLTATPATSGTTDRTPSQKMVVKGSGNVGVGTTTPAYKLDVSGTGRFTGNLTANNLSGTNTGDTYDSMFGDGSDGYLPFDGTDYPEFATYNSGTLTYTLTRDIYPSVCIIQAGVTVLNAGFRIICAAQFTNNGTVSNNGGNASGTTAGTGGTGGFFKAGGTGATGLGTGAAAGAGTAVAAQTNVIGGVGGGGAVGRSGVTGQLGGQITIANAGKPAAAVGSSKIASNIQAYLNPYIPSGTAANIQLQPSIGGSAGAKSATGTTATSGGGGGGGGTVFIASPVLNNYGTISANGGNGGNAAGTGGNFGGGGGGGGGVVALVYQPTKSSVGTVTADGGNGGSSVTGTNGTYPVADADNTATGTTVILITPTTMPSKSSYCLLPVIVANTGNGGVQSVEGYGMLWQQVNYALYNTIATPLRTFELWKGYYLNYQEKNVLDSPYIKITLYGTVTSARAMVDYIHNTSIVVDNVDPQQGTSVASSDSTTNLTVDLGYTPTTGNLVYSVFARVGGTTPVVGTGNTVLNNQNTTPFLYSEVSVNRQTNNHTWTTATAAAGISIDIGQPTSAEPGAVGWGGKIVEIWA